MSKTVNYNRDTLLTELRENVMEVAFDKVNGQPRIMRCTLMECFLGDKYKEDADAKYHTKNPDSLAVWDLDNKEWRSFHVDSVRMVQALDPLLFK